MSVVQSVIVGAVRFYQWVLSPLKRSLFGPLGRCRFSPSCSDYAIEALQRHGAWRGSRLALRRLLRCQPWGGCGWDPVPPLADSRPDPRPPNPQATRKTHQAGLRRRSVPVSVR